MHSPNQFAGAAIGHAPPQASESTSHRRSCQKAEVPRRVQQSSGNPRTSRHTPKRADPHQCVDVPGRLHNSHPPAQRSKIAKSLHLVQKASACGSAGRDQTPNRHIGFESRRSLALDRPPNIHTPGAARERLRWPDGDCYPNDDRRLIRWDFTMRRSPRHAGGARPNSSNPNFP
jgi:hypothetical protein